MVLSYKCSRLKFLSLNHPEPFNPAGQKRRLGWPYCGTFHLFWDCLKLPEAHAPRQVRKAYSLSRKLSRKSKCYKARFVYIILKVPMALAIIPSHTKVIHNNCICCQFQKEIWLLLNRHFTCWVVLCQHYLVLIPFYSANICIWSSCSGTTEKSCRSCAELVYRSNMGTNSFNCVLRFAGVISHKLHHSETIPTFLKREITLEWCSIFKKQTKQKVCHAFLSYLVYQISNAEENFKSFFVTKANLKWCKIGK